MQFLLKSIKLVDFQWQKKLTELFQCMWRKEAIPQDFKDASIIHQYKRKGNPQVCDNHRGISLLSIAGKILAKIILNHLNAHLVHAGLIPESQCGFRKDRGTIDMIFTARQLDTGKNYIEPPECASCSRWTYTRKSVWVQER